MHYDNNPYKVEDGEYLRHHETCWNFDERNENYYLGKINENGSTFTTFCGLVINSPLR